MNIGIILFLALLLTLTVRAETPGNGGYLPMPPTFSVEADRKQILKDYPLGVITHMAAYSHHGQPHKTVQLANGLEGWVYENAIRNQKNYTTPSGQKREVQSLENAHIVSTYTLVFDSNGLISDVLYREPGHGNAESALLVQREAKPDIEKEDWRP